MSGRAGETLHHDVMGGAQLTIFYSGEVNIYEDVPADKAHAIMLLLSNGNNSGISGCYDRPSSKSALLSNGNNSGISGCYDRPSSKLAQMNTETTSSNTFNSIGGGVRSRSSTHPRSSAHTITQVQKKQQAQQLVIRRSQAELPFARKASLARFLEKRKDRVDVAKLVTLKESSMLKVTAGSPACKKMKL